MDRRRKLKHRESETVSNHQSIDSDFDNSKVSSVSKDQENKLKSSSAANAGKNSNKGKSVDNRVKHLKNKEGKGGTNSVLDRNLPSDEASSSSRLSKSSSEKVDTSSNTAHKLSNSAVKEKSFGAGKEESFSRDASKSAAAAGNKKSVERSGDKKSERSSKASKGRTTGENKENHSQTRSSENLGKTDSSAKRKSSEQNTNKSVGGNGSINNTDSGDFQSHQNSQLGKNTGISKQQIDTVVSICTESGFKYTEKPLRSYPADFFRSSGLLAKFDKYLSGKLDKGCNLTRQETETVLRNLRQKRTSVPFLAGAITGVPGSGKTTLLTRVHTEAELNSLVILSNERHKIKFSRYSDCFTAKDILLLATPIHCEVLLIDEYTLLKNGEILLLQKITGARVVLLFGDRAQGDSSDLSSPEWLRFPVVFESIKSHRFGKATADLCGKQGFDFEGGSHEDKVEGLDYEGSSTSTDINIAFTQGTIDDLLECGIECSLVIDVQGNEYDSVSLFIRNEDREALKDPHLRAVALTRHRRLLIVRLPRELLLALFNGELNSDYKSRTNCYGEN